MVVIPISIYGHLHVAVGPPWPGPLDAGPASPGEALQPWGTGPCLALHLPRRGAGAHPGALPLVDEFGDEKLPSIYPGG